MEWLIKGLRLRLEYLPKCLSADIQNLERLRSSALEQAGSDAVRRQLTDQDFNSQIALFQQRHDNEHAALVELIDTLENYASQDALAETLRAYTRATELKERVRSNIDRNEPIDPNAICSGMLVVLLHVLKVNYAPLTDSY